MMGKQERNYDKVQSTSLVYQGIKSLDSLVPSNKRKESTRGLLFLVDTNTNKCLSISFWETEAEMKAHEASGHHDEQLTKGAHLMVAPEQIVEAREYYEVTALA